VILFTFIGGDDPKKFIIKNIENKIIERKSLRTQNPNTLKFYYSTIEIILEKDNTKERTREQTYLLKNKLIFCFGSSKTKKKPRHYKALLLLEQTPFLMLTKTQGPCAFL
jgi:hypothetical protein